jgi:hypothetical protein
VAMIAVPSAAGARNIAPRAVRRQRAHVAVIGGQPASTPHGGAGALLAGWGETSFEQETPVERLQWARTIVQRPEVCEREAPRLAPQARSARSTRRTAGRACAKGTAVARCSWRNPRRPGAWCRSVSQATGTANAPPPGPRCSRASTRSPPG